MSDPPDFTKLQSDLTSALVAVTRATNRVCAEDVTFHRSLNRPFAAQLDAQQTTLLGLAERLIRNAAAGSDTTTPKLPDVEALEQGWRGVVDVLDGLLERADVCLDEFAGLVKRGGQEAASAAPVRREGRWNWITC
jgi:exosome complex exonuclease RRP6